MILCCRLSLLWFEPWLMEKTWCSRPWLRCRSHIPAHKTCFGILLWTSAKSISLPVDNAGRPFLKPYQRLITEVYTQAHTLSWLRTGTNFYIETLWVPIMPCSILKVSLQYLRFTTNKRRGAGFHVNVSQWGNVSLFGLVHKELKSCYLQLNEGNRELLWWCDCIQTTK